MGRHHPAVLRLLQCGQLSTGSTRVSLALDGVSDGGDPIYGRPLLEPKTHWALLSPAWQLLTRGDSRGFQPPVCTDYLKCGRIQGFCYRLEFAFQGRLHFGC